MYQEWDSPALTVERLLEFCKEFFDSQNFSIAIVSKEKGKWLLKANINPINTTQTVRIESKGRKIRLTYAPLSHAADGLARIGGFLVTGKAIRSEAQKQLFLDHVEQQFWENLDRNLANLAARANVDPTENK